MSQYRQDGGGGSTAVPSAAGQIPSAAGAGPNGALEGEAESPNGSGTSGVPPDSNPYSSEGAPPGPPQEAGHGYSPFPYSSTGQDHAFGPRQQFAGNCPKQLQSQHRTAFAPGPPLNQQPGPTPTLNQLLKNPNPVSHRYPNNYSHPEQHYNQWPQNYGPGPAPPPGPYRQQQSVSAQAFFFLS